MQGDINYSAGYVLPTLTILKEKLSQFKLDSESSLKRCKPLAAEILSSVERRFDHQFYNDNLRITSFCHLKFKYSWISEEKTEAAEDLFRSQYEKLVVISVS